MSFLSPNKISKAQKDKEINPQIHKNITSTTNSFYGPYSRNMGAEK